MYIEAQKIRWIFSFDLWTFPNHRGTRTKYRDPCFSGAEPKVRGPWLRAQRRSSPASGPVLFLWGFSVVLRGMETVDISRGGEYLVAHVLETCGVRVIRVDLSGHDLWCRTGSGRLVTVQVKASAKPRDGQNGSTARYEYYDRQGGMKPDIYGFVALDLGLVLFAAEMGKRRSVVSTAFTGDAMRASVARFFY